MGFCCPSSWIKSKIYDLAQDIARENGNEIMNLAKEFLTDVLLAGNKPSKVCSPFELKTSASQDLCFRKNTDGRWFSLDSTVNRATVKAKIMTKYAQIDASLGTSPGLEVEYFIPKYQSLSLAAAIHTSLLQVPKKYLSLWGNYQLLNTFAARCGFDYEIESKEFKLNAQAVVEIPNAKAFVYHKNETFGLAVSVKTTPTTSIIYANKYKHVPKEMQGYFKIKQEFDSCEVTASLSSKGTLSAELKTKYQGYDYSIKGKVVRNRDSRKGLKVGLAWSPISRGIHEYNGPVLSSHYTCR